MSKLLDAAGSTVQQWLLGYNTFFSGLPELVRDSVDSSVVAVVLGLGRIFRFNESGQTYTVRHCNLEDYKLELNSTACQFSFYDNIAQVVYTFDATGQFVQMTDAGGNVTSVTQSTSEQTVVAHTAPLPCLCSPTEAPQAQITGDLTINLVPSGENQGLIESVASLQTASPGAATRRMVYTYYESGQAHGNPGDLKTATQQIFSGGAWQDHETSYYRYYQAGESGGFEHGMKFALGNNAFQRLVEDVDVASPFTASDEKVAQYADNYYEYDAQQRATRAVVRGGLLDYSYSYTESAFADATNNWHLKTVTTNPDGTQEILYSNYLAQVMLREFTDGTSSWITYNLYDADGRLIQSATPEAIDMSGTPYNEGVANLNVQLKAADGLIRVTDYYALTTATETTAGGVAGHVEFQKIKEGSGGTEIKLSQSKYFKRSVGSASGFPMAENTVYRDTAAAEPITTSYAYLWYTDQTQVEQRTTLLPIVPLSQNGTGLQESRVEIYDSYGRTVWSKDARGFITYSAFDDLTGSLIQQIQDVDMSLMSGYPLNPGWTTPSGGGLHLITDMQHDELGRTTQTLGPVHNINGQATRTAGWMVYRDLQDEVLSASGYQTGTTGENFTLVNPVSISKTAEDGSFIRTVSAVRENTSGPLSAGDTFPQDTWVRWSESFTNRQGQQTASRVYHTIPKSSRHTPCAVRSQSDSSSVNYGQPGTNYDETTFGFDDMNRQNRSKTPGGTITRTVFDSRSLAIESWIGTADASATQDHPNGISTDPEQNAFGNNMKRVSANQYDGGSEGGNGNLTQATAYVDSSTSRLTAYEFDFRNRQIVIDGEVDFYQQNSYDNLSRVIQVQRKDTTSGGNLIAQSETRFDDRGRAYQMLRYAVNPATGAVGNALTDNTFFDADGNVILSHPSGSEAFTRVVFDGVGRQFQSFFGYADATGSSSSSSSSGGSPAAGDIVFEQSEITFDNASNVIATAQLSRYHDAIGAGPLTAGVNARPQYSASWFDGVGRQTASANYGNQGNDSTAFVRPDSVPESSDDVLVSQTRYNERGEAFESVDPEGVVNRTVSDDAGRAIRTIANFVEIAAGCDCSGADQNVTTEMTYEAGRMVSLIAKNESTGDQTTRYQYGISLADSDFASADVLRAEIYPDTADGQDAVFFTYNRQGQATSKTDQNGSVHTMAYDGLGRQTADTVSTLGSGVDGAVRRIGQTYEVRGRVEKITSFSDVAGTTVVNEVQNEFNDFVQLQRQYQQHDAAVNVLSSPSVSYAFENGASNSIRPVGIMYPNGRMLEYLYDNSDANKLSRIRTLRYNSINVCRYDYLGSSRFSNVAYLQPGIQYSLDVNQNNSYAALDRFGRVVNLLWESTVSSSSSSSGGTNGLVHLKYGYDRASNRMHRQDVVAQSYDKNFDELYEYDGIHRLKKFHRGELVESNAAIESPTIQQGWTLDATGNWQNFTQNNQLDADQVLDQQRVHNRVNEITNIARAVGQNWAAPQHDRNGNMTVIPKPADMTNTFTATWDAWNRLVTLVDTSSSQTVAEYQYDGQNWRIAKLNYSGGVFTDTTHFYNTAHWQTIEERTSPNIADRQYVWGLRYIDDLILQDHGASLTNRHYSLQDANWNTVALSDTVGSIAERYAYTPYGTTTFLNTSFSILLQHKSIVDNPYLFTSRRFDTNTGLFYFRNRYYQALVGRFTVRDQLGYRGSLSLSLIEFLFSQPTAFVDPFGHTPRIEVAPTFEVNLADIAGSVAEKTRITDLKIKQQLFALAGFTPEEWAGQRWRTWYIPGRESIPSYGEDFTGASGIAFAIRTDSAIVREVDGVFRCDCGSIQVIAMPFITIFEESSYRFYVTGHGRMVGIDVPSTRIHELWHVEGTNGPEFTKAQSLATTKVGRLLIPVKGMRSELEDRVKMVKNYISLNHSSDISSRFSASDIELDCIKRRKDIIKYINSTLFSSDAELLIVLAGSWHSTTRETPLPAYTGRITDAIEFMEKE